MPTRCCDTCEHFRPAPKSVFGLCLAQVPEWLGDYFRAIGESVARETAATKGQKCVAWAKAPP